MRRQTYCRWITMLMTVVFLMIIGWASSESWAADGKYPSRLIQAVICYQPGSTDIILRPFVDKVPEYLGQRMAFVYKPGAAGATGASFVAKAKPDGYTLTGTSQSPVMICPLTKEGLDYTLDDFVPICLLASTPLVVAVKGDSPWKSLKELVADAKKSPGKVTYSTSGVFTTTHVPMEIFANAAGVNMTHVPCAGSGPAVTALLGGHVNMACSGMAAVSPHFKSGALRPIAVFEKERLKEFPDVPTFSELGYPVVISVWYGFFAPKGTSEEVVRTIYKAFERVVEVHKKSIEDQLEKMSIRLDFLDSVEFGKAVKAENEVMKKIIKDLTKSK